MTDPRLQELLDKQDIHECIVKAARAMDRLDDELWAEAWHPDGTDDHGGWIGPASEFLKHSLLRVPRWRRFQHYLLNQLIDIDGDTAHVETYFWAALLHLHDDGADYSVGRYLDRVERRDGVWRIAHRLTVLEWTGALPPGAATDGGKMPSPDIFVRGAHDRSDRSYDRPLVLDRPFRNLYEDVAD